MPIRIGTSGWQYDDWRGVLYPANLPRREWLREYARHFGTVECNNAFYRLPSSEVFANWHERTPHGFVMALKASRFLTHIKRLRDPAEPVSRLMTRAAGLGERLGPVLLQLPPDAVADPGRLEACLAAFPRTVRVAVEPRHPSWWRDEIREVLAGYDAALCWADRLSRPVTPLWRTASWGYVRLHEGRALPWPRYGSGALRSWVSRISESWPSDADVFVYFNNDPGAAAVRNAAEFGRLCAATGMATTRVPARAPSG